MITYEECITEITQALKMFGTYSYFDKPAEMLDYYKVCSKLRQLPIEDLKLLLERLYNYSTEDGEVGGVFVSQCLVEMQNLSDADWEVLMSSPDLEDAFG